MGRKIQIDLVAAQGKKKKKRHGHRQVASRSLLGMGKFFPACCSNVQKLGHGVTREVEGDRRQTTMGLLWSRSRVKSLGRTKRHLATEPCKAAVVCGLHSMWAYLIRD